MKSAYGVTRRAFLSVAAAAVTLGKQRLARAGGNRLEKMIRSPVGDAPRVLIYPGHKHASYGFPSLEMTGDLASQTGLYHYNISKLWASQRATLAQHLTKHLEAAAVVLLGYSKGACVALDVVTNAGLDSELLSRLHLVLVAPAAKVRYLPKFLQPSFVNHWARCWSDAEAKLLDNVGHKQSEWLTFVDRRVSVMYSEDDRWIDPRGFRRLLGAIPDRNRHEEPELKRHLAWRNLPELGGRVSEILRSRLPEERNAMPIYI